jgi:hypothetical protein
MKQKEEKIVMYESDEVASIRTVTGWVDRHGRFWGKDENMARYAGSTHRLCDCGEVMRKGWTKCDECRAKGRDERYNQLPFKEWDGKTPLALWDDDTFFFDVDDIECYLEDNEVEASDLRLVICWPNYPDEINIEQWSELLPEDGDGYFPKEFETKIKEFNEFLKTMKPLSWSPSKTRTEFKQS